ncbi:major facilitator superfamily domain-containing protein [Aspergillus aurantiobrunneus]
MEKHEHDIAFHEKQSPSTTPPEPDTGNSSSQDLTIHSPSYAQHSPTPLIPSEKHHEPPCEPQAPEQPAENPDQGPNKLTAGHYGVVIGAFCGFFASFGWRAGSGFFQQYYQEDQLRNESPSTIAWINSVGFFLMYFGACIVGPVTERIGPQPLLLIGSALHVGGLLGASWCGKFYQLFLTQGIISSLGASAVFFISVQTLARWFSTHQSLVIGIGASGVSCGGVVFPLLIKNLIPSIGFGWTMRCAVLVLLVLMVASNLTLRQPPARTREQRRVRMDMGMGMDTPERESRWAGLSDWRLILTFLGTTLFANGYFVVLTFLVTVAGKRDWGDPTDALVVLNAASFFGRIIPGLVADRAGNFNTMLVLGALSTLLILALWTPHSGFPGAVVFSVTFGFTSASTVSLGPAMVFQISKPRHMTRDLAVLYLVQSFAGLTSSPIGGALLDAAKDRDPLYLQVFCGLMTGVGTMLIFGARHGLTGGVVWKRV